MYPLSPVVSDTGDLTMPWQMYMSTLDATLSAVRGSSTTANRPVRGVFVGQCHFDTTLGQPIWAKAVTAAAVDWVDATGADV